MRRFVAENYPIDKLPRDLHPHMPAGRKVRVIIEDEIYVEDRVVRYHERRSAPQIVEIEAEIEAYLVRSKAS